MTTIEQIQQERMELLAARSRGAAGRFGGFFAALGAGLRGLGEQRAGVAARAEEQASGAMSELFARAVSEGSNSAMDWLYYAAQLRDPGERRYCATRALQIDPESPLVRAELRRLR
jgi:hypothetical protein